MKSILALIQRWYMGLTASFGSSLMAISLSDYNEILNSLNLTIGALIALVSLYAAIRRLIKREEDMSRRQEN
ncbi:MAG: hypothetical protein HRU12_17725 [Phaeodactylibacter sp.]|nr:hypothetical protein [Phaeodactylibacter sp.]